MHCIVVLDSADCKRYTYAKRSGRNKHRNAKSCPSNQDQSGKMEDQEGVGYMCCVCCVDCVDL